MADGSRLVGGASLRLLTAANIVTFARLCAVPIAVWLALQGALQIAFWLFAAAGASDALDGWLARHGQKSSVGAVLDPLADKALLISMAVTLAALGLLPAWIVILIVFRDVMIVGGVLVLMVAGEAVAIRPLAIAKLATALQILLVGAVLFAAAYGVLDTQAILALLWATAAMTLASGAAYVRQVAWAR